MKNKHNIEINGKNYDVSYTLYETPVGRGLDDETYLTEIRKGEKIVYSALMFIFDDYENLLDDDILCFMGNIEAEYYDAIKLARSLYKYSLSNDSYKLCTFPIVIMPHSYYDADEFNFSVNDTIANYTLMKLGLLRENETLYSDLAVNLTPYKYAVQSFFPYLDKTEFKKANIILEKAYKESKEYGFKEPVRDPTLYSASRYIIKYNEQITEYAPEETSEIPTDCISLKEDKEPYIPVMCFSEIEYRLKEGKKVETDIDFDGHWEYIFSKGHGIDCFHRLNLSSEDLGRLYKLAKAQRKLNRLYRKEDDSSNTETNKEQIKEQIRESEEKCDLYRKEFEEYFNNPYELDFEIDEATENIGFEFYDYEYSYFVTHVKNGWRVSCRISYYENMDEPYVTADTPNLSDSNDEEYDDDFCFY